MEMLPPPPPEFDPKLEFAYEEQIYVPGVDDTKPRLIVGIVVDQMRYDYLIKYAPFFGEGGFRRLLADGFTCHNMHYNYVPTYTGPGHASIYTGTTPTYHGIIANDWYVRESGQLQYCAKDTSAHGVGTLAESGKMSPIHLRANTFGDELRLSTQQKSKVIGVSLKDRGAILPAGRMANAAYWYAGMNEDAWVTSDWYGMNALPEWVKQFNARGLGEKSLRETWFTLGPDSIYAQTCMPDNNPYEAPFKGQLRPAFPYQLSSLATQNGQYEILKATPFGNQITTEFALAAIEGEELGRDEITDLLCLSYSSTDYVGHQFGPESWETMDVYLRLDLELERLLNYLDSTLLYEYTVFLTADHGGAYNTAHLQHLKGAANYFVSDDLEAMLEKKMNEKYGPGDWIVNESNLNVFLNRKLVEEKKLVLKNIQQEVASWVVGFPGVHSAYTQAELAYGIARTAWSEKIQLGYDQARSGDVVYALLPGWMEYTRTGTTHGSMYNYDTHVPALFYGAGIFPGSTSQPYSITDIIPTLAALYNFNVPNAAIGHPIIEIVH
jgi:hypothetical protein